MLGCIVGRDTFSLGLLLFFIDCFLNYKETLVVSGSTCELLTLIPGNIRVHIRKSFPTPKSCRILSLVEYYHCSTCSTSCNTFIVLDYTLKFLIHLGLDFFCKFIDMFLISTFHIFWHHLLKLFYFFQSWHLSQVSGGCSYMY